MITKIASSPPAAIQDRDLTSEGAVQQIWAEAGRVVKAERRAKLRRRARVRRRSPLSKAFS